MIIKPVGTNPSIKNANSSFSYPTDIFSTLIYMGVEFFVYGVQNA